MLGPGLAHQGPLGTSAEGRKETRTEESHYPPFASIKGGGEGSIGKFGKKERMLTAVGGQWNNKKFCSHFVRSEKRPTMVEQSEHGKTIGTATCFTSW